MTDDLETITPREGLELYLQDIDGDLSPNSVQAKEYQLGFFVDWCEGADNGGETRVDDLNEISGRDFTRFKNWRSEDINKVTLRTNLSALRSFMRFCVGIDAVAAYIPEKINVPRLEQGENEWDTLMEYDDAESILQYLRQFEYASFDHTLFLLQWKTGVRMSALHSLDVDDFDNEAELLGLHHRPDEDTRLENGPDGERIVTVDAEVEGDDSATVPDEEVIPKEDVIIPVDGGTVECSTDGPLAVEATAELTLSSDDGVETFVPATVGLREDGGDWETVFRGYVATARHGTVRVSDPSRLLANLPANKSFTTNPYITDVLDWVCEEFTEYQPDFEELEVTVEPECERYANEDDFSLGIHPSLTPSFGAAEHTLADVLSWLGNVTGTYVWIVPFEGGIGLHFTPTLSSDGPLRREDAETYVPPTTPPITTVRARGSEIFDDGSDVPPPQEAGIVFVELPRLKDRVGREMGGRIYESEATSLDGLEIDAKRELKRRVTSVADGRVTTSFNPGVRPYDVIEGTDEVVEVTHYVPADGIPTTSCRLSPHVGIDAMETTRSEMVATHSSRRTHEG